MRHETLRACWYWLHLSVCTAGYLKYVEVEILGFGVWFMWLDSWCRIMVVTPWRDRMWSWPRKEREG